MRKLKPEDKEEVRNLVHRYPYQSVRSAIKCVNSRRIEQALLHNRMRPVFNRMKKNNEKALEFLREQKQR